MIRSLVLLFALALPLHAQTFINTPPSPPIPVAGALNVSIGSDNDKLKVSNYPSFVPSLRVISATAAVNNQTTLTIPAPPPGQYVYVCSLLFVQSNDATGTAATNAVTTSTNFGGFAIKYSYPVTVNGAFTFPALDMTINDTCVKSTTAGTATTFVSPAALTNAAFSWYSTYYYGF